MAFLVQSRSHIGRSTCTVTVHRSRNTASAWVRSKGRQSPPLVLGRHCNRSSQSSPLRGIRSEHGTRSAFSGGGEETEIEEEFAAATEFHEGVDRQEIEGVVELLFVPLGGEEMGKDRQYLEVQVCSRENIGQWKYLQVPALWQCPLICQSRSRPEQFQRRARLLPEAPLSRPSFAASFLPISNLQLSFPTVFHLSFSFLTFILLNLLLLRLAALAPKQRDCHIRFPRLLILYLQFPFRPTHET